MATITRRGNGWFAQVRRKGYTARYRTFPTKAEAKRWAREQELALDGASGHGTASVASRITLGDLMRRYRECVTPRKRSSHTEDLRLGKMLRAALCDVLIEDLHPSHFADYRDNRLLTVKAATVRRELSIFRVALEVARREWGMAIVRNPVDDVGRPAAHDARQRRLESDEARRLVDGLARSRNIFFGPLIWFLVETGLRRGEALALEWKRIDLATRTALIPTTKSGRPRVIPLTDHAMELLDAIPRRDARVFPISGSAVQQAWCRLTARAGISDLRVHDLRHEAMSRFSELGLNVPELASISGHSDVRMLLRYTHIRPLELARKLAGRSWENEIGLR